MSKAISKTSEIEFAALPFVNAIKTKHMHLIRDKSLAILETGA